MPSGDAYDVFVSYAHSDGDVAAELNGWLGAQGFSTFFDRSELRPGLRWVPALEEAIGRSRAVVILVGPHGIGNTQQYERELALVRQTGEQNFPVIPVLMPGCEAPPTGFLQLLTWVDLSKRKNVREQTGGLEALRAALRGETVAASAIRASICPYRGLEPFREEDAAFFCGRDDAIRELVARVREHAFVTVVGPSGSGKSSLVFAGLLPALRMQGRTTMWDVITLRPGKSPLSALAEAFGTPPDNVGVFENDAWLEKEATFLRAGDAETLTRAVDRRLDGAPEKPDRLLIYVDQWEELYAMAPPPEDKARLARHSADVEKFIELLVAAASGASSRASVVMTVRADFYNPLIRNPLVAALLPKQQVNIPPMSRDDLRSAIEAPAKKAGLSFAPPQLVDRVLDDVGLEEGRLPLLQFALKETWGRREATRLTAEAYTEVGGVAGAIQKTAENAYECLTPSQKDAARRLFLRLITPGEGQADTRARSAIPDDPEQRGVVSLFANPKTRLLVTALQAGPAGGDARATVEVAHEALIQRWPTLRDWVRANRDNMRARAAILRAKAEWEENGEQEKFLLDPGVQLERGRALLNNPGDVAVDDIRDYVDRSLQKDQRRLAAEREADLADQKRIADARKRTAQVAVAGLVIAMVVAAAAVWQYFDATAAKREALAERDRAVLAEDAANKARSEAQTNAEQAKSSLRDALIARQAADEAKANAQASAEQARANAEQAKANLREAQIAQSHFLADQARQQRSADPAISVALALEALPDHSAGIDRPYLPEAELQLDGSWRGLRERMIFRLDRALTGAAFSPDGQRIVTSFGFDAARIWDAASGKPIGEPLKGHKDRVNSAAFSPDGKRIVTSSDDGTAQLWDAASGNPIGEPLKGHRDSVWNAAFSPDGKRIVTASHDNTAQIWDAASGKPIGEPLKGHGNVVVSAAFSPDGQRIVTASYDDTARIWDATSGKPIGEPLKGHGSAVVSAAFSPDGQRIVTASWDKTARIWDAANGKPIGDPLRGHTLEVLTAAFSPDGERIVTGSSDKTARIWDAATGKVFGEPLSGHEDGVRSAAFSPDGKRIFTASSDETVRIWDASREKAIGEPLIGHEDIVFSAAFSPDGQRIVTASWDKTARIWDATSGKAIGEPLKGHEDRVWSAAFSPDGRRIVTASSDKTARIWDAASGKPIGEPLRGHEGTVVSAAFSPDGKRIVTASSDKTVRIWDAKSGKPMGEPLRGHDGTVISAAFSPDGQRIITASDDKTARIWDAASGKPIGEPLKGHEGTVHSAAFSPDGKRIVTASWDNTVRIWDSANGQPLGEPLKGHGEDAVYSAAFSPDGLRIITASQGGTAQIWDAATGKPRGEPLRGHRDSVISATFSPDGQRAVTASSDKTARVWDVFESTERLVSRAKADIPRCLTLVQRKTFFLPPEPPTWCIEMEKWPYDTAEWKQWLADARAGKKPPLPAARDVR
jgi:WD40 repeat protein/energy-coupling factor transporter ATP-binding protein EcfA2